MWKSDLMVLRVSEDAMEVCLTRTEARQTFQASSAKEESRC